MSICSYGFGASGGGEIPDAPGLAKVSVGDGFVRLALSGLSVGDRAYIRSRNLSAGATAWSTEDLAHSITADGNFDWTGLLNSNTYEFTAYIEREGVRGEWAVPVLGTPLATAANTNYQQYRVTKIERVPQSGLKRLFLEKVGKPLEVTSG